MLSILYVLENSENYEKIGIENEMVKQQPTKNTCNSHATCPNSSIHLTVKQNNQEMLEKELNKAINKANDYKATFLSFANKSKDTNKKFSNNKDNSNNVNANVPIISVLTILV